MKKNLSLMFKAIIFAMAFSFTACSDDEDEGENTQVVSFEDLTISGNRWVGPAENMTHYSETSSYGYTYKTTDGTFTSNGVTFSNSYTEYSSDSYSGTSWSGFGISTSTSKTFTDYTTDCNSVTGSGNNGSKTFLVGYNTGTITISSTEAKTVMGCYITNNTYAYNSMTNGDTYAKKFESGDYFKIIFTGDNGNKVEFYLANMSTIGIVNTWQWCDLSLLGKVKTITFSFESSDTGDYGMNTPAYFCMDDLKIAK